MIAKPSKRLRAVMDKEELSPKVTKRGQGDMFTHTSGSNPKSAKKKLALYKPVKQSTRQTVKKATKKPSVAKLLGARKASINKKGK